MTVLIIITALAALVIFLLMLPAKIYVLYKNNGENGTLKIAAGIAGVRFTVFNSSKKKTKDTKKVGKTKKPEPDKPKKEVKKTPKEFFAELKETFDKVLDVLSFLKKKLVFYKVLFKIRFGTGDAASTGILTGTAWSVVYNILAVIDNKFVLKKQDVKIAPDFLNTVLIADIEFVLGIRVIYALVAGLKFLIPRGRKEKNK